MFLGKNTRTLLSLVLACALLVGALLGIRSVDLEVEASTISELQSEYDELEKKNKELSDKLSQNQSDQEEQKNQQNELSEQIEVLQEQIDILLQQISELEKSIISKKEEIRLKEEQIEETYALFKTRLRTMYMEGNTSALDLLLGSDNLNEFLTNTEYSKRISQQTQDIMDQLSREKDELDVAHKALEEDKESLNSANENLKTKRNDLQGTYDQSLKTSQELANTESYLVDQKSELEAQRAQVEADIQYIIDQEAKETAKQQAQEQQTPGSGDSGSGNSSGSGSGGSSTGGGGSSTPSSSGFIWPAPNFSLISSYFGYRTDPFTGAQKLHKGIDIAGGNIRGTYGLASNAGRVIYVGWDATGYGNYVMVDHGGGYVTLYAHCDQILVSYGQQVSRGEAIVVIGNTGGSTGPHLHFEVRVDGTAVDPLGYVNIP